MPDPQAKRVEWAPHDVILDYFIELQKQDAEADLIYVLTLLLIRRHILRIEETDRSGQRETMVLYCPRNESEYRVPVVHPRSERMAAIQADLETLLFSAVD